MIKYPSIRPGGIKSRLISHKRNVSGKPEPSGYVFTFYDSITSLPAGIWDRANRRNDIFLSTSYLAALEKASPVNMKFKYVMISGEGVSGIVYFQILELNPANHRYENQPIENVKRSFAGRVHDRMSGAVSKRLLVCGNMLISGEHCYSFEGIPQDKAMQVIAEIAYILRRSLPYKISATLMKDFYNNDLKNDDILGGLGYASFDAGPNMVVEIRKSWVSFEDYIGDMKPKYKKRVLSAIKKGKPVEKRSLSVDELIECKMAINSLYRAVSNKAKFRLFCLTPDFFIELKRNLRDKFICEGYFTGSQMLGFTTRIFNGETMEGYVHGLSYERNKEYELYQNFLLDDMRTAIEGCFHYVNTGRTSMAMKSSIGAIPEELVCYMRFSGTHLNVLLKPLFSHIKPNAEYCRNPFE